MSYIVSEMWIVGRLSEDWVFCHSQQITFAVANESLIPDKNLIKRAPETQNL